MRSIINISLPSALANEVKKDVKSGNFASTSEFFRHLWRLWKNEQLAAEIRASERDFAKGKFKALNSFKDLR
ncbi:MAG: ribbon-helix-helix domain-containing protein [Candidatus Taylorbacteria bacterium]|nr:ribbon-helix-helix domain-containing protein [Candidatus Taylorbacteria bacterium]